MKCIRPLVSMVSFVTADKLNRHFDRFVGVNIFRALTVTSGCLQQYLCIILLVYCCTVTVVIKYSISVTCSLAFKTLLYLFHLRRHSRMRFYLLILLLWIWCHRIIIGLSMNNFEFISPTAIATMITSSCIIRLTYKVLSWNSLN